MVEQPGPAELAMAGGPTRITGSTPCPTQATVPGESMQVQLHSGIGVWEEERGGVCAPFSFTPLSMRHFPQGTVWSSMEVIPSVTPPQQVVPPERGQLLPYCQDCLGNMLPLELGHWGICSTQYPRYLSLMGHQDFPTYTQLMATLNALAQIWRTCDITRKTPVRAGLYVACRYR